MEPRVVKNIGTDHDGTPWQMYVVQDVQLDENGAPVALEGHAVHTESRTQQGLEARLEAVSEALTKGVVTYNWDSHTFEGQDGNH